MKILYHINNKRFIVRYHDKHYIVSIPKKEVQEIIDVSVQSILRQGYWKNAADIDDDVKRVVTSLVDSLME